MRIIDAKALQILAGLAWLAFPVIGQECPCIQTFSAQTVPNSALVRQAADQLAGELRSNDPACEAAAKALFQRAAQPVDCLAPVLGACVKAGSAEYLRSLVVSFTQWTSDVAPGVPAVGASMEGRRLCLAATLLDRIAEERRQGDVGSEAIAKLAAALIRAFPDSDSTLPQAMQAVDGPGLPPLVKSDLMLAILEQCATSLPPEQWCMYFELSAADQAALGQLAADLAGTERNRAQSIAMVLASAHAPAFQTARARLAAESDTNAPDIRREQDPWFAQADRCYQLSASVDSVLAWLPERADRIDVLNKQWAIRWLSARKVPRLSVEPVIETYFRAEAKLVREIAGKQPESTRRTMIKLRVQDVKDSAIKYGYLDETKANQLIAGL